MEDSPISFMPERYWTEEKERTLISFFSKNSCLWNHKLESYKNRPLRWKMLEHLRILLSAQPPPAPFTVEDIKSKFKNLRTTFQRQHKAVKASEAAGLDDCKNAPLRSSLIVSQEESEHVLTSPGLIISILPPESSPTTTASSPSYILSNMVAKSFWTEEKERALIDFYAEHSCLWNKSSKNHNNRPLRLKLLKILRRRLSDHSSTFSIEDIKCKFKNLRTVFNREYKVVQVSRTSDKRYHSKWKHYQRLLFLCEWWKDEESPDNPREPTPREALELGRQSASSAPSSSSCSTQTNNAGFSNASASSNIKQTDADTDTSAGFHIFTAASDYAKAQDPKTASRSGSPPDGKPCANPPPRKSSPVQLECGPISDSRCRWNESKVHQLISFYSEHDCLWNYKSERYKNKATRQSLLETLSVLLSSNEPLPFAVKDIKTKFRNLRTIFQREHKAVNANKTCGSEDFYVPKWKHYRELMFLCDSCDEEQQPDDVLFHQAADDSLHPADYQAPLTSPSRRCRDSPQTANRVPNQTKTLESPPLPPPPDARHSMSSSSSSTCSSHPDGGALGHKRGNQQPAAPPAAIEALDFMKKVYQSQITSPHAGFLKYVEECLNEAPPDKVKRMKMKIIETIHNMSEDV
ncbi:uncharacterized protein LOC109528099 isoform X2 [Hippocampus comes]|uniref:uncharacterized protein LOC109528099 isoform X2 n=1 Tax=Hippocampus comes TaxID=109280 RepID=UPI00094EEFA8|nr:PREDICTED: uncharacterized protein LOC109528099 isoform X2 [Hippocampus comes]